MESNQRSSHFGMISAHLNTLVINVVIALVAYALYLYTKSTGTDLFRDATLNPKGAQDYLLAQEKRRIHEFCTNDNQCYYIEDEAFYEKDAELVVHRRLISTFHPNNPITTSELTTPTRLKPDDVETIKWEVNHLVVPSAQLRMLIASPILIETLSMTKENKDTKMLVLGHNGGVLSSFYAALGLVTDITTVEPTEDIISMAKEWFKHEETPANQVNNEEYERHLESQPDGHYDVVMIDSCEVTDAKFECPSSKLKTEAVIEQIARILKKSGTLGVKIHPTIEDEVVSTFERFFKSCSVVTCDVDDNKILMCTHRKGWTWKENRKQMLKHLQKIDEYYEFKLSPYFIENKQ